MPLKGKLSTRAYNSLWYFLELERGSDMTRDMIKARLSSEDAWAEFARTPQVGRRTLEEVKKYIGYAPSVRTYFGWIGGKPQSEKKLQGVKDKLRRKVLHQHERDLKGWARKVLLLGALQKMQNVLKTDVSPDESEALFIQATRLKKFFGEE